jgi:uncharacterized SAM-binding protein YcdF (DUF218 family)
VKYISWISCIFCFLCVAYMIVLMVYAGSRVSYLWLWPAAGILFAGMAVLGIYSAQKQIVILQNSIKALFAIILMFMVFLLAMMFMLYIKGEQRVKEEPKYMIVLGAQVKGRKVSKALRARLDRVAEYAQEYPDIKIIVSGGQGKGEDISEAEAMFRYLTEQKKIDAHRIEQEAQSKNTEQNIQYSWKLVKQKKAGILIVSNRFHVYRAISIAKKKGIQHVYGIGADTDSIMCIHYYLREVLAVIKYKLSGVI